MRIELLYILGNSFTLFFFPTFYQLKTKNDHTKKKKKITNLNYLGPVSYHITYSLDPTHTKNTSLFITQSKKGGFGPPSPLGQFSVKSAHELEQSLSSSCSMGLSCSIRRRPGIPPPEQTPLNKKPKLSMKPIFAQLCMPNPSRDYPAPASPPRLPLSKDPLEKHKLGHRHFIPLKNQQIPTWIQAILNPTPFPPSHPSQWSP